MILSTVIICFCGQCDYKAAFTGDLKKHLQSIHEGVCYPCGQCAYKATFAGNLTKHVESIHEGVRYPCDQCDYKATRKIHLKTHIKSKHCLLYTSPSPRDS